MCTTAAGELLLLIYCMCMYKYCCLDTICRTNCYCKPTQSAADVCFAAKVVNLESPPAAAVKLDDIRASLEQHKPAALFLCQVITIVLIVVIIIIIITINIIIIIIIVVSGAPSHVPFSPVCPESSMPSSFNPKPSPP